VDLNLDTLKREIIEYLDAGGFAIYHSTAGGLEGQPMVLWDTEEYPDYQMFLATARQVGAKLILFATAQFEEDELEEAVAELDSCNLDREERSDLESRLADLRCYEGLTCSLEIAFDHESRFYVYELRPDWYEEFLTIGDEIDAHTPAPSDDDGSLGGLFSNN
jgi:hypothetical protein